MTLVDDLRNDFSRVFSDFVNRSWSDSKARLHGAIRYCLEGDGKRTRALLALLICESYGRNPRLAFSSATAVEMVHAYSLAHDDLPCMDDDSMRRGRPSLHVAFDECTALLAGDAILADAFRVLVDEEFFSDAAFISLTDRSRLVRELALASGGHGMVYGQDRDMYWTGRNDFNLETLETIHRNKTGALIGAACAMGAISGGASHSDISAWREIGTLIGIAFQAVDDALDGSTTLGKTPGKDLSQKKLTYMTLFARNQVMDFAREKTESAIALIPSNTRSDRLIEFIGRLLSRQT